MSSPSPSSSSSPSPSIYRVPIVTTTIFSPSATSHIQPANNDHTTIPIGSIVGGCLAGIILAVAAVAGWHLWGRSIKRKEEAKRKEAISHHTTVRNTRLNAFASFPPSYTPSFRKHTQDRKVKFAVEAPNIQFDEVGQLPAIYHASLPARPSPLSQSEVAVERHIVK